MHQNQARQDKVKSALQNSGFTIWPPFQQTSQSGERQWNSFQDFSSIKEFKNELSWNSNINFVQNQNKKNNKIFVIRHTAQSSWLTPMTQSLHSSLVEQEESSRHALCWWKSESGPKKLNARHLRSKNRRLNWKWMRSFFTRPEFVLTDLRAFLPSGLYKDLKEVVTGHFTLLTVLEACYAWIR